MNMLSTISSAKMFYFDEPYDISCADVLQVAFNRWSRLDIRSMNSAATHAGEKSSFQELAQS